MSVKSTITGLFSIFALQCLLCPSLLSTPICVCACPYKNLYAHEVCVFSSRTFPCAIILSLHSLILPKIYSDPKLAWDHLSLSVVPEGNDSFISPLFSKVCSFGVRITCVPYPSFHCTLCILSQRLNPKLERWNNICAFWPLDFLTCIHNSWWIFHSYASVNVWYGSGVAGWHYPLGWAWCWFLILSYRRNKPWWMLSFCLGSRKVGYTSCINQPFHSFSSSSPFWSENFHYPDLFLFCLYFSQGHI